MILNLPHFFLCALAAITDLYFMHELHPMNSFFFTSPLTVRAVSVLVSLCFVFSSFRFFFHCDSRVVPIVQCPRILSRHCKCVHRYVSWQHFWSSKKDTTEQHSQTLLDKIKSQANLLFCDVYLCSVLRFCLSHHKYIVHHGLQTDYYELKSTFKKCRKAVKRWRI